MPPTLALALWFILLVALWRFDPAKDKQSSWALWLPLIWMAIKGSRLPSQWLGVGGAGSAAAAYQEGNLFDRAILLVLILLAARVLFSLSFPWGNFAARNVALTLLLTYALMSVVWSDFPFVSFKRWVRDLGNYLMILVVLTDPRPLEAVRTVLRRLCYLLVPLSVVLIKYYPDMGKSYDGWSGVAFFQGVTTSKNMLGVLCLVSGLFFFWDTLMRWADRKDRQTKRIIQVNVAFMAMTLWLLHLADSATSTLCLALGCLVVAAAHSNLFRRHPARLKVLIPVFLGLYLILEMGFGVNNVVARAVGRDPTLTGRTEIWNILLGLKTNPIVGTGYESFWLGDRLDLVWMESGVRVNQAHNGYLEVYLNLGLVGLFLLGGFLIASYKNICKRFSGARGLGSFELALWTVMPFYNVTEAAFKSHLLWVTFLLAAISVPGWLEGWQRVPQSEFLSADSVATLGQGTSTNKSAMVSSTSK